MKYIFFLLLFLGSTIILKAQTKRVQRRIQFNLIGKDSINLSLNEDYDLIEDSCADIVRHTHVHLKDRKFFGAFRDVSKFDTSVVLSEGNYTADGLKDGLFIAHYLNGNLRSKGAYQNDKYTGHWETFYEDGKPAMTFDASGDIIKIIDVWGTDGKKIVNNGKGTYQVSLGAVSWKGKLENGLPDGTWHAFKTDDATQANLAEESFKKGLFQKGSSPVKDYTDASRIMLVNPLSFPFNEAEKMRISIVPCNGVKRKHIVTAQYSNGTRTFILLISEAIRPIISRYRINGFEGDLVLSGKISDKGEIDISDVSNIAYESLGRNIGYRLRELPLLQPATVDGKAVEQPVTLTFTFRLNGGYSFRYRQLPVKAY